MVIMVGKQWYYIDSFQTVGPVDRHELKELFQNGSLNSNTYVWYESLTEWRKAGTLLQLSEYIPKTETISESADFELPPLPHNPIRLEEPEVRPWPRYFARLIDIYFISLFVGLGAGLLSAAFEWEFVDKIHDAAYTIVSAAVWVPIEAIFIAAFGKTPGKWILNMEIVSSTGVLMDYQKAIRRSLLVWVRGYGLGIGIVAFITMIVAYNHLTRYGVTTWDRDEECIVKHGAIGLWRILAVISLIATYIALNFLIK
ncbi:RDD family protein [bacterium]|nr:RDD family protein [bacterium]